MHLLIVALPLIALIVVLVLQSHRFRGDYVKLVEVARDEDDPLVRQKLLVLEDYRRKAGLRRALMALVMGPAICLVVLLGDLVSDEHLADAMIAGGLLVCAYGLAGLLTWVLVDRKKPVGIDEP